ncbi:protein kinase [Aureococcus anophagefferens]|nr:protein kinase [Aureococcus anophagefferens]
MADPEHEIPALSVEPDTPGAAASSFGERAADAADGANGYCGVPPLRSLPDSLRLKFHHKREIRVVAVNRRTERISFRTLKQRLTTDYGFELSLAYQDGDGDLITLASQNDLNELLNTDSSVANVRVIPRELAAPGDDEPAARSLSPPASTRGARDDAAPAANTNAAAARPQRGEAADAAPRDRAAGAPLRGGVPSGPLKIHTLISSPTPNKNASATLDPLRAPLSPLPPSHELAADDPLPAPAPQIAASPPAATRRHHHLHAPIEKSERPAKDRREPAPAAPSPGGASRATLDPLSIPRRPTRPPRRRPRTREATRQPSVVLPADKASARRAAVASAPPDRGGAAPRAIRWQRGEMIGKGAFGSVYLSLNLDTGELMAVKHLDCAEVSSRERSALENEVSMMKGLCHPNIVRYLGVDSSNDALAIFLEYVPGGSLRSLLDKFGKLEEDIVRLYSRQILLGLEYLHGNAIAHRDIKAANVLVSNDGSVKLADFGASKRMAAPSNLNGGGAVGALQTGGAKGTPLWMAPEVIKAAPKSQGWRKADVWSVGCTVIEMSTGRPPWSQYSNPVTAMYHIACVEELPDMPPNLSDDGIQFLWLCFQREPRLRPEVTALLLQGFVSVAPTAWRETRTNYQDHRSAYAAAQGHHSAQDSLYPSRPSTASESHGLGARRSASLRIITDGNVFDRRPEPDGDAFGHRRQPNGDVHAARPAAPPPAPRSPYAPAPRRRSGSGPRRPAGDADARAPGASGDGAPRNSRGGGPPRRGPYGAAGRRDATGRAPPSPAPALGSIADEEPPAPALGRPRGKLLVAAQPKGRGGPGIKGPQATAAKPGLPASPKIGGLGQSRTARGGASTLVREVARSRQGTGRGDGRHPGRGNGRPRHPDDEPERPPDSPKRVGRASPTKQLPAEGGASTPGSAARRGPSRTASRAPGAASTPLPGSKRQPGAARTLFKGGEPKRQPEGAAETAAAVVASAVAAAVGKESPRPRAPGRGRGGGTINVVGGRGKTRHATPKGRKADSDDDGSESDGKQSSLREGEPAKRKFFPKREPPRPAKRDEADDAPSLANAALRRPFEFSAPPPNRARIPPLGLDAAGSTPILGRHSFGARAPESPPPPDESPHRAADGPAPRRLAISPGEPFLEEDCESDDEVGTPVSPSSIGTPQSQREAATPREDRGAAVDELAPSGAATGRGAAAPLEGSVGSALACDESIADDFEAHEDLGRRASASLPMAVICDDAATYADLDRGFRDDDSCVDDVADDDEPPPPISPDGTGDAPAPAPDRAGGSNGVTCVVFTPGGDRVVTGCEDRVARIWSLETGVVVHALEGHESRVTCVQMLAADAAGTDPESPGGPRRGKPGTSAQWSGCVVTASADHTVRLWDVRMRRPQALALRGHTDTVNALAADADNMVWSASRDTSVRAWDLRCGRGKFHLTQHFGGVTCLAYDASLDGDRGGLLSGARDTTVHVWAKASGACMRALRSQRGFVQALAVVPKRRAGASSLVACGGTNGKLRLWDHHKGKCVKAIDAHATSVTCCQFATTQHGAPNGFLVSGGGDGCVKVWDARSMVPRRTLASHGNAVDGTLRVAHL